ALRLGWTPRINTAVARQLRVRHGEIAQCVVKESRGRHHLDDVARAEVAGADQTRPSEDARVISIAVGLQIGQPTVKGEAVLEQARAIFRARALRVERAAFDLELTRCGASERCRLEIHRAREGCCPRAARADTALDLYRLQAARDVGKI